MSPLDTPRAPRALALLGLLSFVPCAAGQTRQERAAPYAIHNVKLSSAADAPAKTILVRDGRIEAIVEAESAIPPGRKILEGEGRIALPAFVDAWTASGCTVPPLVVDRDRPPASDANVQIDMREANRKGIHPAFRAIDVADLGGEIASKHRAQGFALLLCAPGGDLLAGRSALLTTRDAATRDVVVKGDVFHHAIFRARGEGYPSTLMGNLAQLRQFFLDARRQNVIEERFAQGRPGERPPWDADLDAAHGLLDGEVRLVCEADRARDIERWIALADEFGLRIAIAGGRESWKLASELARRGIPVFLALDWGEEVPDPVAEKKKEEEQKKKKEEPPPPGPGLGEPPVAQEPSPTPEAKPESAKPAGEQAATEKAATEQAAAEEKKKEEEAKAWEYVEPEGVRMAKRHEWEETRDCAKRLQEAGVTYAFCTGRGSPDDLVKNVRTLVESGMTEDEALAALTSRPAGMLGVEREFGFLTPGHSASFGLWTASPTTKDAQLACLFVEGYPYPYEVKKKKEGGEKPAEGIDLSGSWTITGRAEEENEPSLAKLTMAPDGALTGTLRVTIPESGEKIEAAVSGRLEGKRVSLEAKFTYEGLEITVTLEGTYEEGAIRGERKVKSSVFEDTSTFTATRAPGPGTDDTRENGEELR
jgi:hypothetical protein